MLKDNKPKNKKSGQHGAQLKPSIMTKLYAYFDLHAHALFSSLGRLTRTPAAFSMTVLVLAISMALTTSFYLLVKNAQQLTGNVESSNQISVFLKANVSPAAAKNLLEHLQQDSLIDSAKLITSEEALAEFKAYSGFGEAVDALQENPLPSVMVIQPKNTLEADGSAKKLLDSLIALPETDVVQSDLEWVNRLQAMVALVKRIVFLLACLFALAVLLIIGNTTRLELQGRREEVLITKLVGATHAFIRRPFLYTGFWLSFLGSVLAWIMVTIFMLLLRHPVADLAALYTKDFQLAFLDYTETLGLFGVAIALGVIGAWMVLGSQLREIRPD